jgi:hypothetical protein
LFSGLVEALQAAGDPVSEYECMEGRDTATLTTVNIPDRRLSVKTYTSSIG